MSDAAPIVVATGRFQTIHVGSVAYLQGAAALAAAKRWDFYVLTGPRDAELPKHAYRAAGSQPHRALRFAERRLLISTLVAISPAHILEQASTPHHGDPDLENWIANFFCPLTQSNVVRPRALADRAAACVHLAVVRKPSDVRTYRPGDGPRHYADYLVERYPGIVLCEIPAQPTLSVPDMESDADRAQQQPSRRAAELGGSTLPPYPAERAACLPPVVLAAELLVSRGLALDAGDAASFLAGIARRFGNAPAAYPAIEAPVIDFIAHNSRNLPKT